MKNVVILIFATILIVACGQEEPVEQTQMPMGEQPMGQQQMPPGHPGMGTAPATTSIEYELPEGWVQTQPSSPMRLDQATIPGDAGEGELAVFFFGPGGGGGTEANLQRWVNQMSTNQEPTHAPIHIVHSRLSGSGARQRYCERRHPIRQPAARSRDGSFAEHGRGRPTLSRR